MLLCRQPLYQCHVCKSYYYFISIPSSLSGNGFFASDEVRARSEGQPVTIRTRSLLFIRLYLFSDLLTNWKGEQRDLTLISYILYSAMYSSAHTCYLRDLNYLRLSKPGLHRSVDWILRLFKYHRSDAEPLLIPFGISYFVLCSYEARSFSSQSSLLSPVQALMCPQQSNICTLSICTTVSQVIPQTLPLLCSTTET